MYAFVLGINGRVIIGRDWNTFMEYINLIIEKYNTSLKRRFIIYVHNLAYEFQFIRKLFEWEKVFSVEQRKPVYAITKSGIEFRCSYLLSGLSLDKLGENLVKYKVTKAVGFLDYSLIRHSNTPLTKREIEYIARDGLVVMAHIQEEIERLGDITKLPITHTGYVRNNCRQKTLQGYDKFEYSALMRALVLNGDEYKQCKRTFMGGFVHANRNYADKIIENVDSFDFTSSYPAVMISEEFPMSKPFHLEVEDEDRFLKILKSFCCMFTATFYNLREKVSYENYISISRCLSAEHYRLNNGRVIEASMLSISITEQDYYIIDEMYEWDEMKVANMTCFYKGYLPKPFIEYILEVYGKKTMLKGVEGKEQEYMVSKGEVNSLYGMAVTDPCKDDILYSNDEWSTVENDIDILIDKYNRNGGRFLYYPWGIWVTAYARRNLFTGILEFGDDYRYSDTDSIKVVNSENHKIYIEAYNVEITKKIRKCLNYYGIDFNKSKPKTIKGVEKPIGVWDYEGRYTRFKTLGAKRYMVEHGDNIEITIAGVSKKAGMEYLRETYKDNDSIFNAFEENLVFPAEYTYIDENGNEKVGNGSGKLLHTYIDCHMSGEIIDYMGNKSTYHEFSGIHMENTAYELSIDDEYRKILMGFVQSHIC